MEIPGIVAALATTIMLVAYFPIALLFSVIAVGIGVIGIWRGGRRRAFIVVIVLGGLGLVLSSAMMLVLVSVGGGEVGGVRTTVVERVPV
ncbi:hypothetical protein [Actinoalloteichus hymeniacidonis]|uniref:hypothetical protein n=1 Tax=Actinoalloteichus hymeniacidonis TaxID=340345 RepID=UPI000853376B|nr:hypothetical protein [Actinoalloteichus hymeniacidonis]MBB5909793.1 phosphoglycerol transferase MdoB-like AlkP superfamily enzyme [Actinoalloteichus hymeniacidonis]